MVVFSFASSTLSRRLDLIFSYDQEPGDIIAATQLLMDLTPDSNKVRLRIEYALENAKKLLDDFEARPRKDENLCDFLRNGFRDYFKRNLFKVSIDSKEVEALMSHCAILGHVFVTTGPSTLVRQCRGA